MERHEVREGGGRSVHRLPAFVLPFGRVGIIPVGAALPDLAVRPMDEQLRLLISRDFARSLDRGFLS